MTHTVKYNQIYESCQPTRVVEGVPVHTRIRVCNYPDGSGKVFVATLLGGGRREGMARQIKASQLHETAYTASDAARRTGYALVASPE